MRVCVYAGLCMRALRSVLTQARSGRYGRAALGITSLPKRDELLFCTVLALPKLSRMRLDCPNHRTEAQAKHFKVRA
jgi:hypothetical protein